MTEAICQDYFAHGSDSYSISAVACCASKRGPNPLKLDKPPQWLHNMLRTQFFSPCQVHREHKKNEATYFCADCCVSSTALCSHCLSHHAGHRVIQIRRYVYCDVVRACDMSTHLDVSGVQTYIINQAKVMFLNQRPQSKMGRPGAPDACQTCARTLRDGCSYCSLACKVEGMMAAGGKLQDPASAGSASDSGSDCWPSMHQSTEVEHHHHHRDSDDGSGDSSSSHQPQHGSHGWPQQHHLEHVHVGAAATQLMRRHSDSESERSSGSHCSRRKQTSPRRSPLL